MIDLLQACEIAYHHFEQTKEIKGIESIEETEVGWIFWGRDLPPGIPEYGSVPIIIYKEDGDGSYFYMSEPGNLDIWKRSHKVEVPEKYKLQYHPVE